MSIRVVALCSVLACTFTACDEEESELPHGEDEIVLAPPELIDPDVGALDEPSVAALDTPSFLAAGDPTLPVEAKVLVIAGTGSEAELGAIKSVLDHRGVPYDVFVAANESALAASRLQSGERGLYQATILTSASLGGTFSSTEWTVLADYEAHFAVRRAVLTATPDPAMGWGSYTTQDTSASALTVRCTSDGATVFRDVRCDLDQKINGDTAYLSTPVSSALTPLLTTSAGKALAAIHTASDGRQSLLLLFRQGSTRPHSQQFLHGVLGWVTGGTYLGERRIDMGIQIDDLFLASDLYTGGTYRLTDADMRAAKAWKDARAATALTPGFRLLWAFNGLRATDGDALTEEVRRQNDEWHWVTHTFSHHHLDAADYSLAYSEFTQNIAVAEDLPLIDFEYESFVPPNISGLVNPEVMQAAVDVGIRYAVTDTSKPGCDNPKPNTAFYNALQPSMLLIPRRPTNLFYNVSTPAQWQTEYNDMFRDHWGRDSTYAQILDQESEVLMRYLMRGDADPWMFHQADIRAYDGVHSLLGDLIDATLTKLDKKLRVPVRTPAMISNGERFARRINLEGAGVRATLYRGRALVIDAGREVEIPVTGVRSADGESYGGDVIGMVTVRPGTTACIPLDAAGVGCSPAPTRVGGAGTVTSLPRDYCDGTGKAGLPPAVTQTVIPRASTWKYWDRGDQGTSWRGTSFDDSAWSSGAGPLGFGETYIRTTTTSGRVSYYFRKNFTVSDLDTVIGVRGELMYDDGAVVYLNGTEIARAAMPTGTISASTLSTGHEASNSYSLLNWDAAIGALVAGTNTIAVEVHQSAASSSDLVFDLGLVLEMSSEPPPDPPPVLDGGVARGSAWWYWDGGGDLGTAWRTSAGGSGWESGDGPLGYGETYLDTTITSSSRITTYFTTQFTVDDASAVSSMIGQVMYDDGFVAYVNGVEIGRAAMPSGTVTATTLSSGHEAANAYVTFDWSALRTALRDGTNTIAVEVHQSSSGSSDLVFDLALTLETDTPPPPANEGGVPRNATWSYSTDGIGWSTGQGVLGYGESYIDTLVPASSRITTYFETTFTVEDATAFTSMMGEVMYDDGFVAYLNGVELGRAAMPTGTITASTLSTGHEANDAYVGFNWAGGLGALRDGSNTIRVEVHQSSSGSSDLVFDLALQLGTGAAGGGISRNATWSYSIDGTGWSTGAGVLGYGESYIDTAIPQTTRITTYFERTFTIADASAMSSMAAEVMYDDGFVAYINGVEVGRAAMPTGTVTSSTLSTGHEANDAYQTFNWSAGLGALQDGSNVIRVEVHQASSGSSDLVFDLALDVSP